MKALKDSTSQTYEAKSNGKKPQEYFEWNIALVLISAILTFFVSITPNRKEFALKKKTWHLAISVELVSKELNHFGGVCVVFPRLGTGDIDRW